MGKTERFMGLDQNCAGARLHRTHATTDGGRKQILRGHLGR